MKQLLSVFLLFVALQAWSQTDQHGNPVFNSVIKTEETIGDFTLVSNYYTLKNNIDNKTSSVYISPKPNLNEVLTAAVNLPSDFFMVLKGRAVVNLILLINTPTRKYFVINPATGKQGEFACSLKGDITENRAAEILKENYDDAAKIDGGKFYCNNKQLNILSTQDIRKDVLALIEKHNLSAGNGSGVNVLSKEQLKKTVLTESREGGKMDFFTEIKGREMEGIEIKPGVFTTRTSLASYKWGRANFELGVNTVEDAFEFWAELKGRQPNEREKSYIKKGFNKELEQ